LRPEGRTCAAGTAATSTCWPTPASGATSAPRAPVAVGRATAAAATDHGSRRAHRVRVPALDGVIFTGRRCGGGLPRCGVCGEDPDSGGSSGGLAVSWPIPGRERKFPDMYWPVKWL